MAIEWSERRRARRSTCRFQRALRLVIALSIAGASALDGAMAGIYTVKAKKGALVRVGAALDTAEVDTLAAGTRVTIAEETTVGGRARARLTAPVAGWASSKLLELAEAASRPRIAALHGTAANAAIFSIQLGQMIGRIEAFGDLAFIDGPKEVDAGNAQAEMMRKFFGKNQVLREFGNATLDDRGWRTYDDLDARLDACEAAVRKGGELPEALLCFSQGSNFATMLAARAERAGNPYKCVVLLCGARPGWTAQCDPSYFATPLQTPALVGSAERDGVVGASPTGAPDGPDEIAKLFANVDRCSHPEEHRPLPANKAAKESLQATIVAFLAAHLAA